MWYAAQSALVAMLQPHLLFTGLGGVIAAAVGGVIATVIMRIGKRSTAPRVQPAPAPERRTPPGAGYGETAPPPVPARRLHPGPIALSEPESPSDSADDDRPALTATLPLPEATIAPTTDAPILPPTERIVAAWRAEQSPTVDVQHRGLWGRKPFAPPEDVEPPLAFESQQAPVWRSGFLAAPQFEALETFEASPADESSAASAPIWGSWLHAAPETPGTPAVESSHEGQAPIWPSFLRPE